MNIARSSLKLFSANIANAVVQFVGIAYFARELGATQMGVYFLFQVVLGLIAIPADFGLRRAVEKRISEGQFQGTFVSSAIVLKLVPIGMIIIGILLVSPYLESYIGTAVTTYLAVGLLLQEASKLSIAVLRGELRVDETAVLQIARNFTWLVAGSFLIHMGFEAEALIYSLLAGMAVVTVWGWYKVSISPKTPTLTHARSLFDYSKYNIVSSVGGYLFSWTDVAVIGLFLTQAHVGAYEIAWRVSALSILFSRAIASTIFPQVSEWDARGDQDRIEELITKTLSPSLMLVIPAFFGTVLFSEEILNIVFGAEYTIAATVLILLMIGKIFDSIQLVIGRSLLAINQPDLAARAAIISLSTNVILNIIFVLRFGILGAALATVLSSILNDFLHLRYLRKFISVQCPWREIAEILFVSGMMTVGLYGVSAEYQIRNLIELILIIAMGVGIYGTMVLVMPNLRLRIFEVLSRFRICP